MAGTQTEGAPPSSVLLREILETLHRLEREIHTGPDGEGQDMQASLEACRDDIKTVISRYPRRCETGLVAMENGDCEYCGAYSGELCLKPREK